MKYLVVLFLVAMSLQPPVLQACDMDADQQPSHHAVMHDDAVSGCCNPGANPGVDQPTGDCGGGPHCAFLSLGFLVIPPSAGDPLQGPTHHYVLADDHRYSGPSAPPLYRPPIA